MVVIAVGKPVKHRMGSARTMILDLAIKSPRGITCDEAEECLGLTHQTASAAITAMRKAGMLLDSGHKRMTRSGRVASVYVRHRR